MHYKENIPSRKIILKLQKDILLNLDCYEFCNITHFIVLAKFSVNILLRHDSDTGVCSLID